MTKTSERKGRLPPLHTRGGGCCLMQSGWVAIFRKVIRCQGHGEIYGDAILHIIHTHTSRGTHVSSPHSPSERNEPNQRTQSLLFVFWFPLSAFARSTRYSSPLDKKTFEDILLSATIHARSLKGLLLIISASEDAFLGRSGMRWCEAHSGLRLNAHVQWPQSMRLFLQ